MMLTLNFIDENNHLMKLLCKNILLFCKTTIRAKAKITNVIITIINIIANRAEIC